MKISHGKITKEGGMGPKVAVDKFVSKHGLDFDIHGTQYIIYCDKS